MIEGASVHDKSHLLPLQLVSRPVKDGRRDPHIKPERPEIRPVYPDVLEPLVHREPEEPGRMRALSMIGERSAELSTHMSPKNVPNRSAP